MELKRKLSSRKFWLCVCSFVTAVLAALNFTDTAAKVTAVIMAFGSVISYIIAEGFVDAASASVTTLTSSGSTTASDSGKSGASASNTAA